MQFASIPEILEELRQGRFIVLVDDPSRENEGDLILAAQKITPQHVNFMLTHGRGEICTTIPSDYAKRLNLPLQADQNTSPFLCAKCVTVDAAEGTTTGVSVSDQAVAIAKLADPTSVPADFNRPGHTRPIRARDGGVLVRTGHTEGSVDLARMSGMAPVGVLCEILDEDGEPRRLEGLAEYAERHGLKMTTIEELIRYRRETESLVKRVVSTKIPTPYGTFDIHLYSNSTDSNQHIALTMGCDAPADGAAVQGADKPILLRVHSECLTGDIFGSMRCDCGRQLDAALRTIGEAGRGVVLYLRQEGRGIGLEKKLLAYRLQAHGMDTVEANQKLGFRADERDYGIGAQILHHLGVRKMQIMTNNPKKLQALKGFGMEMVERVPLEMSATKENIDYLRTKRDKLGHLLEDLPGSESSAG
jgi:3,4-dihydroxy 2-butanone 4-phosphate synthase / GTP cyclohydrolase II